MPHKDLQARRQYARDWYQRNRAINQRIQSALEEIGKGKK